MPDSQLSKDVRDISVKLAENTSETHHIRSSIEEIKESLERINGALFVGNGQQALMARVASNDVKITKLEVKVDKIDEATNIIAIDTKKINSKHNLGLFGLVLVFALVIIDYTAKSDIISSLIHMVGKGV